jgi:hypothetical protein
MRLRMLIAALILAGLVACTGSDDTAAELSSPCDLTDATKVQSVFAGTVADGVEGGARNCDFDIEDGDVLSVAVFDYGTDDGWDSTRDGFDANRGGVTDVEGVGDEAFYPNDVGPTELVVTAGGRIFGVGVFTGFGDPPAGVSDDVADLAGVIAADLG